MLVKRARLASLCLCVLVSVSGCGGWTGPGTSTGTESPSPAATQPPVSTPSSGDCTATTPVLPEHSGVEPLQYPAFPSEVNRTTATAYVEAFYRAVVHNRQLDRYERIAGGLSVSTSTDGIRPTGEGYVVSVTADVAITEAYDRPVENRTSTPTPAVGDDHFTRSETYYLTDRFLIELSTETTVACAGS